MSDALGTATEMKAQRNYAGHRLSPWLGHLMVSRQETARPLLTPGEIMQLPPADELVLVSGLHPIRAKKARYYEDPRLKQRVLPPPSAPSASPATAAVSGTQHRPTGTASDWKILPPIAAAVRSTAPAASAVSDEDPDNAGIRREPDLPEHEAVAPEQTAMAKEFDFEDVDREEDDAAVNSRLLRRQFGSMARQATMDPDDGIGL